MSLAEEKFYCLGIWGYASDKDSSYTQQSNQIWHRDIHTQPDKKYAAAVGCFNDRLIRKMV